MTNVPMGKPGQVADALEPRGAGVDAVVDFDGPVVERPALPPPVVDPIAVSSDVVRVQLKTAALQAEEDARLRASIRRVMARGSLNGDGGTLFCVFCGKGFEYDSERRPMHTEPIEDCPGPRNPPPPVFEQAAVPRKGEELTIRRPLRPAPFGERE